VGRAIAKPTSILCAWIVPSQLPAGLYRIKVAIWNDENEDHAVGAFSNPFVVE